MPFVVFIAAPGMDALKRMYEEGRRRGLVGHKGVIITNHLLSFLLFIYIYIYIGLDVKG
jgi:hypothetical protein